MDQLTNSSTPVDEPTAVVGKTYTLTEKQLNYLISSIIRNISLASNNDRVGGGSSATNILEENSLNTVVNSSVNVTSVVTPDELSDDEKITMIFYVLVFFVWYGGLIFLCLIGFGVYKKPSSYEIYRRFVDRKEIREKLKQKKQEELEKRKVLRQSSLGSSMSTCSFDQARDSSNGGLNFSNHSCNLYLNRSPRSVPSSFAMGSTIYPEEEEGLLNSSDNPLPKSPSENGRVVFDFKM